MPSAPAGSGTLHSPSVPGDAQIESLRLPPHSVEAEQAVLGGLLLSNAAWDRIGDVISESDFYRADHRVIWRVITHLVEENKPADVLTVAEALKISGEIQRRRRPRRTCTSSLPARPARPTSAATRRSFASAPSCASWPRSARTSPIRRIRRRAGRRASSWTRPRRKHPRDRREGRPLVGELRQDVVRAG